MAGFLAFGARCINCGGKKEQSFPYKVTSLVLKDATVLVVLPYGIPIRC
jgi:hypothetical protein